MGEKPTDRTEEEAKLELPSLSLPRVGGKRKRTKSARPAPEPAPEPEPALEPAPVHDEQPTEAMPPAAPVEQPEPVAEEAPARARPTLPPLPARVAVVVTGVVVGLFGSLLTFLSLRGCETIRGTDSCGGPGFFLLVAILILMVLLGSVLLGLWGISDPRSSSFLAVGVLCVVMLVTLMEQLFSPWMFLVVPIVSAAAYLLSHWVTTTFVEPVEKGPGHDIR